MNYNAWYKSLIATLVMMIPTPFLLWFGKVLIEEGEPVIKLIGQLMMLLSCSIIFLVFIRVYQLYGQRPEEEGE